MKFFSKKILLLITSFILSLSFFYLAYKNSNSIIKDSYFEQINSNIYEISKQIKSFKDEKYEIIATLANHKSMIEYFENNQSKNIKSIFYDFIKSNKYIFQIRIIDLTGNELIRVNKNKKNIYFTPEKQLQNKSNRYYFKEFIKLKKDQQGFSKLDLNVENSKIEVPFKSTIRFGMPIFIDGNKKALIVINYYMNSLLQKTFKNYYFDKYLIDEDGYFVTHSDSQKNWSRYRKNKLKITDTFDIKDINGKFIPSKSSNIVIKEFPLFGNKYYVLYNPQNNLNVIKFIDQSKYIGFLIFLGGIFLVLPFIVLIYKNLNNLKDSNKKIESILNNTSDAIIVLDKKGIIKELNKSAIYMFKYKKEEIIGKDINILISEFKINKSGKLDKKLNYLGEGSSLTGIEKNGNNISISLIVTKFKMGSKTHYMANIKDLTQIKKLEEDTKQKEHLLLHQSKLAAMGEMTSAIAHQWRQPLNSIGFIIQDLVSAYKHKEFDEEYLNQTKKEIMFQLKYMSDTIDEFRKFFKKDEPKTRFNLIDSIKDINKLYKAQLDSNRITLKLKVENKEFEKLSQDEKNKFFISNQEGQLKQVIVNIVSNAKDAIMHLDKPSLIEKQIIIEIKKDDKFFIIKISDFAGGIKEDNQIRIFEPYFTTKKMGTGLGLYISKSICEKSLGGVLKYEENIKDEIKGSSFIIKLALKGI